MGRLERRGYVVHERHPTDRRSVIVCPVEAAILPDLDPPFDAMRRAFGEMLAHYSDDEIALIGDFMARARAMTREQIALLRGGANRRG